MTKKILVTATNYSQLCAEAKKLFEDAKIDINDVSAENKLITDGENTSADIDRHVDDWIKAHQAEYDKWLADARAAAK